MAGKLSCWALQVSNRTRIQELKQSESTYSVWFSMYTDVLFINWRNAVQE
jgi:hypothetical protein